jgi:hypothetical protein
MTSTAMNQIHLCELWNVLLRISTEYQGPFHRNLSRDRIDTTQRMVLILLPAVCVDCTLGPVPRIFPHSSQTLLHP